MFKINPGTKATVSKPIRNGYRWECVRVSDTMYFLNEDVLENQDDYVSFSLHNNNVFYVNRLDLKFIS